MRGLKSMPLMMGTTDGVSEANANRQWEMLVAGIKSGQHLVENLLAHHLTLGLQAEGYVADVEVRFAELRASEMLRDEQTKRLLIANTKEEYDAGWIDQDEAADKVVGHPPVEKEPRNPMPAVPGEEDEEGGVDGPPDPDSLGDVNPDPGSDR